MPLTEAHPWLQRLSQAIAVAAFIGGGTTIMTNKMDNVRQDQQIEQYEDLSDNLEEFNNKITETDKNLAVLNERLKNLLETLNDRP